MIDSTAVCEQMTMKGEKLNKTVTLCVAARTGDVETLQRASKSALNRSDDSGMTTAMWAAARGQLAALRVIVERGFVISQPISQRHWCL